MDATASVFDGPIVHDSDDGRTTIHPQVVAKIVALAVGEIEGVTRLVPCDAEPNDFGVHVEITGTEAAVDVRVVATYGTAIPAIVDAIRRNVINRIKTTIGLSVVEVNIDIVDLSFADDEEFNLQPTVPAPLLK
jgi:uncharacterized alkaline shock family protein YloU